MKKQSNSLFSFKNRKSIVLSCTAGLVGLLALVAGCGGGGPGPIDNVWTQEKQTSIDQGRATVQSAISAEGSFSTSAGKHRVADAVKNTANIEYATVTSDGSLSIKYKQGGVEVYLHDTPTVPPSDRSRHSELGSTYKTYASRSLLQNNKVVIFNSVADDPEFLTHKDRLTEMAQALTSANQQIQLFEGANVNPATLANLANKSLIILLGHGGFYNAGHGRDEYIFQTAAPWSDRDQYTKWTAGDVARLSVPWGDTESDRNDPTKDKVFIGVTASFWAKNYTNNHFHQAMMINGSCNGSRDTQFVSTLSQLGVASYVGYDNVNDKGAFTEGYLVDSLIGGLDIKTACENLPLEYRENHVNELGHETVAFLTWSGLGVAKLINPLDSPSFLHIDSPANGSSTTNPVAVVSGHVDSWHTDWHLSLELNSSLAKIPVTSDGTFNMSVALASGDNTVQVRLETPLGVEHHILHVTANIPAQAFWSEMRWNTNSNDIDLHLLPVGATPWTSSDCYYGNKTTSWGASLDVDITTGYGPEHITAPTTIAPGKYLLFVHYFDTHGVTGPVSPSVSFVVNGVTKFFNCPQPMTAAENVWNVAYITYPSGEITPLNQFVTVGRGRGEHPPKK